MACLKLCYADVVRDVPWQSGAPISPCAMPRRLGGPATMSAKQIVAFIGERRYGFRFRGVEHLVEIAVELIIGEVVRPGVFCQQLGIGIPNCDDDDIRRLALRTAQETGNVAVVQPGDGDAQRLCLGRLRAGECGSDHGGDECERRLASHNGVCIGAGRPHSGPGWDEVVSSCFCEALASEFSKSDRTTLSGRYRAISEAILSSLQSAATSAWAIFSQNRASSPETCAR